jgi:hypothetical protein
MNKLILVLFLTMFGCATQQATRQALNCQAEPIKDSSTLFIGGSRVKDEIGCKIVQVPVAPKSVPLEVRPELIDKNQK